MARHRILLTVTIGLVVLSLTPGLWAGPVVIASRPTPNVVVSAHVGLGHWVGAHVRPQIGHPPRHKMIAFNGPWRHRFLRLGPPRCGPAVVHRRPAPPVVVRHAPIVTVRAPAVPVAHGSITVWVTNSNGSRTSVKLTRSGPGYLGPRGEWYDGIPTNEHLRVIYGF